MKKAVFFVTSILVYINSCMVQAQSYNISNLTKPVYGGRNYSGDGGPDTLAELNNPQGIAVDGKGNIYIADYGNNRVRKIDVNGIITTFAGDSVQGYSGDGGPANKAELFYPIFLAADKIGNIYISDNGNDRIRKVDTNGIITTFAGNGIGGSGGHGDGGQADTAEFSSVYGVAVGDSGNVFVSDISDARIRKINNKGIISTYAGGGASNLGDGGPATMAVLSDPWSVGADDSGNVYVEELANVRIRKIDNKGIINEFAGNGNYSYSGDGGPADSASIEANSMGCGAFGSVFIADGNNYRIRVVNSSGIISSIAGTGSIGNSTGGPALLASFGSSSGVATDAKGNVYFVDGDYACVRMLSPIPTSIAEKQENSFLHVFPVPFTTTANIVFSSGGKYYIEVDDVTGRKLENMECFGKQYVLSRNGLAAGVYFLRVYDAAKEFMATEKIIIE
jgi:hypothetical protein